MARSDGAYQAEEKFGTRQERQGLKSLRENSVLEGHGISRDVSSLRDSPLNLSLPGTPVPGYRLCRARSTNSGQALRDYFVAARKWHCHSPGVRIF